MKPKCLTNIEWLSLKNKFNGLTLEIWKSFDALKKLSLLRGAKIKIDNTTIFGKEYDLNYPNDIYLYDICTPFKLDITSLNRLRRTAINDRNEVGGIINYDKNIEIEVLFSGNSNRIKLDLKRDTHTLFHTHPKDDRKYDPPSILDIISYLGIIVKYLADLILDMENGIEHAPDDPLVIQNSLVFTKDEVYVYYISSPLVIEIVRFLMDLYMNKDDFIFEVQKLLEQLEISYTAYLFNFNRDLDLHSLNEYLKTLSSLGIIIKRFEYLSSPEVYVTL